MKTERNYNGEQVGSTVHAFERAGLGKAPFRFAGYEERKHQSAPGEPVRAGSSCDYCGTSIMGVYWLKGADGSRFKVGCDCVEKTGDQGLIRFVNAKAREIATKKAHARQDAKIEAVKARAAELESVLRALPHPETYWANRGETAWDYVYWILVRAGRKGKYELSKYLDSIHGV